MKAAPRSPFVKKQLPPGVRAQSADFNKRASEIETQETFSPVHIIRFSPNRFRDELIQDRNRRASSPLLNSLNFGNLKTAPEDRVEPVHVPQSLTPAFGSRLQPTEIAGVSDSLLTFQQVGSPTHVSVIPQNVQNWQNGLNSVVDLPPQVPALRPPTISFAPILDKHYPSFEPPVYILRDSEIDLMLQGGKRRRDHSAPILRKQNGGTIQPISSGSDYTITIQKDREPRTPSEHTGDTPPLVVSLFPPEPTPQPVYLNPTSIMPIHIRDSSSTVVTQTTTTILNQPSSLRPLRISEDSVHQPPLIRTSNTVLPPRVSVTNLPPTAPIDPMKPRVTVMPPKITYVPRNPSPPPVPVVIAASTAAQQSISRTDRFAEDGTIEHAASKEFQLTLNEPKNVTTTNANVAKLAEVPIVPIHAVSTVPASQPAQTNDPVVSERQIHTGPTAGRASIRNGSPIPTLANRFHSLIAESTLPALQKPNSNPHTELQPIVSVKTSSARSSERTISNQQPLPQFGQSTTTTVVEQYNTTQTQKVVITSDSPKPPQINVAPSSNTLVPPSRVIAASTLRDSTLVTPQMLAEKESTQTYVRIPANLPPLPTTAQFTAPPRPPVPQFKPDASEAVPLRFSGGSLGPPSIQNISTAPDLVKAPNSVFQSFSPSAHFPSMQSTLPILTFTAHNHINIFPQNRVEKRLNFQVLPAVSFQGSSSQMRARINELIVENSRLKSGERELMSTRSRISDMLSQANSRIEFLESEIHKNRGTIEASITQTLLIPSSIQFSPKAAKYSVEVQTESEVFPPHASHAAHTSQQPQYHSPPPHDSHAAPVPQQSQYQLPPPQHIIIEQPSQLEVLQPYLNHLSCVQSDILARLGILSATPLVSTPTAIQAMKEIEKRVARERVVLDEMRREKEHIEGVLVGLREQLRVERANLHASVAKELTNYDSTDESRPETNRQRRQTNMSNQTNVTREVKEIQCQTDQYETTSTESASFYTASKKPVLPKHDQSHSKQIQTSVVFDTPRGNNQATSTGASLLALQNDHQQIPPYSTGVKIETHEGNRAMIDSSVQAPVDQFNIGSSNKDKPQGPGFQIQINPQGSSLLNSPPLNLYGSIVVDEKPEDQQKPIVQQHSFGPNSTREVDPVEYAQMELLKQLQEQAMLIKASDINQQLAQVIQSTEENNANKSIDIIVPVHNPNAFDSLIQEHIGADSVANEQARPYSPQMNGRAPFTHDFVTGSSKFPNFAQNIANKSVVNEGPAPTNPLVNQLDVSEQVAPTTTIGNGGKKGMTGPFNIQPEQSIVEPTSPDPSLQFLKGRKIVTRPGTIVPNVIEEVNKIQSVQNEEIMKLQLELKRLAEENLRLEQMNKIQIDGAATTKETTNLHFKSTTDTANHKSITPEEYNKAEEQPSGEQQAEPYRRLDFVGERPSIVGNGRGVTFINLNDKNLPTVHEQKDYTSIYSMEPSHEMLSHLNNNYQEEEVLPSSNAYFLQVPTKSPSKKRHLSDGAAIKELIAEEDKEADHRDYITELKMKDDEIVHLRAQMEELTRGGNRNSLTTQGRLSKQPDVFFGRERNSYTSVQEAESRPGTLIGDRESRSPAKKSSPQIDLLLHDYQNQVELLLRQKQDLALLYQESRFREKSIRRQFAGKLLAIEEMGGGYQKQLRQLMDNHGYPITNFPTNLH
jgi:hypothetical protein